MPSRPPWQSTSAAIPPTHRTSAGRGQGHGNLVIQPTGGEVLRTSSPREWMGDLETPDSVNYPLMMGTGFGVNEPKGRPGHHLQPDQTSYLIHRRQRQGHASNLSTPSSTLSPRKAAGLSGRTSTGPAARPTAPGRFRETATKPATMSTLVKTSDKDGKVVDLLAAYDLPCNALPAFVVDNVGDRVLDAGSSSRGGSKLVSRTHLPRSVGQGLGLVTSSVMTRFWGR